MAELAVGFGEASAMLAFDRSVPHPLTKSGFVEPMECLPVSDLPTGSQWLWELKLDGYRALAVKSAGKFHLYSRNGKSFDKKFSAVVEALRELPDETTVDGEIVALDDSGRPDFNLLQNSVSAAGRVRFFVFDILQHKGRDVTTLPLIERRKLLASIKFKSGWLSIADYFETDSSVLVKAAREQGLEGVVGKRKDSLYESGKRTGAWIKHRLNLGQEFVIVGYYRGNELVYVARTRNGFVPASRRSLFERLKPLIAPSCPFANLPETRKARWGEALTAEKMKKCIWVRPELVARVEFLEWTDADHLRHSKFAGLREDKEPRQVVKENQS
jgi:DNA ligase D-like protein (predicted ligase)